jgi:acetolactate synthase-1/2/3 large subunit
MNAFEIATAVQEQIPIRVFVFNDERLGMVENGHEKVYGRRPRYSTGPLDICSIARGLGAATARVDHVGQLDAAMLDAPGPVVIEMRIDADIVIPKVDRVAVMATDKIAMIPVTPPSPHAPAVPAKPLVAAEQANDNLPVHRRAIN